MQWGLALNPNQNGDPSFCVKMGKFCEKVPLLGPPQKKRKEATKFCPQITTSCFFVYAHRILYIILLKQIYTFHFISGDCYYDDYDDYLWWCHET